MEALPAEVELLAGLSSLLLPLLLHGRVVNRGQLSDRRHCHVMMPSTYRPPPPYLPPTRLASDTTRVKPPPWPPS